MTDDLRTRVADILSVNSPHNRDRAIDIVWNEAHRAGFNEAIEAAAGEVEVIICTDLDVCTDHYVLGDVEEALLAIRVLRKPEEGHD